MRTRRFEFGYWNDEPLTPEKAQELCQKARIAQKNFSKLPLDKILTVIDRVGQLWSDRESPWRREATDRLVEKTDFSLPMIEKGLDELGNLLNSEVLLSKMKTELQGIPVGEGFSYEASTQTHLQYQPLGVILHILSGNVFLVGPGSLVESLLTKNVSLLKMPSEETFFLPFFLASLQSVDLLGEVVSSILTLEYSSQEKEIIDTLKRNVDGIVIWGGENAVQTYRNNLPARTRTVVFGPKISFAIVTEKGLQLTSAEEVAKALASELSIWDQNACTAPQACFVQKSHGETLLACLAKELDLQQEIIPAGSLPSDNASEIRKLRGVAELCEARGQGRLLVSSEGNLNWTVIYQKTLDFEISPLHRTLKILSYESLDQIKGLMEGYRGYLQTIGVTCSPQEQIEIAETFSELGAQRIFSLGEMSGGEIDDPHDGAYDLPQLLNLVVVRNRYSHLHAFEVSTEAQRRELINGNLRKTLRVAEKSPYYFQILKQFKVESVEDLKKLPLLTRENWENLMLPNTSELQTRVPKGGYVTRSGGSTGVEKFSYFDKSDWMSMLKSAEQMFRSIGLESEDRIANFMSAGDLYGSFISFNDVNNTLGAMNFCFAGATDPESFLRLAKQFNINVVQGLPNVLMQLLRACHSRDKNFRIQKLIYAGQPMSPSDKKWLKIELKTEIISSVIGTTEANHVAFQCSQLDGRVHHLVDDYNWIEIVSDKGETVEDGDPGRVAITSLQKMNFPVIRYLNGDAGRILKEKCVCGRQSRLMEYMGRSDDIICIGKMNLNSSDVRIVLEDLDISNFQIVGKIEDSGDKLILRVETPKPQLSQQIQERLMIQMKEFKTMLEQKTFEFEIEELQLGGLKTNPRTGKVKTIIDERF